MESTIEPHLDGLLFVGLAIMEFYEDHRTRYDVDNISRVPVHMPEKDTLKTIHQDFE